MVVRGLASHQCGLGSIPTRCHMLVEFVVGSRLAHRVFLQALWFSSLYKNQHSKFQFDQNRGPTRKPAAKANVAFYLKTVISWNIRYKFLRHLLNANIPNPLF